MMRVNRARETIMIPALLETIGALSLLVSVAAKIALLRGICDEAGPAAPEAVSAGHVRAACASRQERHDARRERRARLPLNARCVRAGAGRAALSRPRRHG